MDSMGDSHPTCPKCDAFMDRGHLPDYAHGDVVVFQAAWAPGDPEPRRFFLSGIKADAEAHIPLAAYRCSACGFVEFYARSA